MEIQLIDVDNTHKREIWLWRNDFETRNMSFGKEKISWENHCKWFREYLLCKEKRFFIGKINTGNIGTLRFDKKEQFENSFSISITIAPKYRGLGYGQILLDKGINKILQDEKKINYLFAEVKKENRKSCHLFRKLKFEIYSINDSQITFFLKKDSFY